MMKNEELLYRGIIIRQANYGDAHRMLWIFTETDGIIKAVRYGVRGKKTSNAAAFQMFSYADYTLRPSNGDVMTATAAEVIDSFYPVSEDIKKLALASYLADVTMGVLGEANPDRRVLSLLLNAVYALSYRDVDLIKLKTVYELKLMCISGFMPNIGKCGCGEDGEYFSLQKGTLLCKRHSSYEDVKINRDVASLMNYVINCDDKKMLSFTVGEERILSEMNSITEKYIQVQCEVVCKSLTYFYSICAV